MHSHRIGQCKIGRASFGHSGHHGINGDAAFAEFERADFGKYLDRGFAARVNVCAFKRKHGCTRRDVDDTPVVVQKLGGVLHTKQSAFGVGVKKFV